jgi:hypothetical protein
MDFHSNKRLATDSTLQLRFWIRFLARNFLSKLLPSVRHKVRMTNLRRNHESSASTPPVSITTFFTTGEISLWARDV